MKVRSFSLHAPAIRPSNLLCRRRHGPGEDGARQRARGPRAAGPPNSGPGADCCPVQVAVLTAQGLTAIWTVSATIGWKLGQVRGSRGQRAGRVATAPEARAPEARAPQASCTGRELSALRADLRHLDQTVFELRLKVARLEGAQEARRC